MAASAKVTIDEAIKTASEQIAGKIIEAELERKHDKLVWEVQVLTAGPVLRLSTGPEATKIVSDCMGSWNLDASALLDDSPSG